MLLLHSPQGALEDYGTSGRSERSSGSEREAMVIACGLGCGYEIMKFMSIIRSIKEIGLGIIELHSGNCSIA